MRTEEEAGGPLEVAMLARVLLEVCDTLEKVDRLVRKRGKCVSGGCIYGRENHNILFYNWYEKVQKDSLKE